MIPGNLPGDDVEVNPEDPRYTYLMTDDDFPEFGEDKAWTVYLDPIMIPADTEPVKKKKRRRSSRKVRKGPKSKGSSSTLVADTLKSPTKKKRRQVRKRSNTTRPDDRKTPAKRRSRCRSHAKSMSCI